MTLAKVRKNEVIHGDVYKEVVRLPDKSVDLIVCDGPYGTTDHEWDHVTDIQRYNENLLRLFSCKLKQGGALYLFGKHDCVDFFDYRKYLNLKARIIWFQPNSLAQGRHTFTNNYDVICYFVRGESARRYNLDDIRIPQLVSAEQRERCENVPSVKDGTFSGTKYNPHGKNPGDVWIDIKSLTYRSNELVAGTGLHTIQKPEALIKRLVLASTDPGDLVVDPFSGTGTTAAVCKQLGRDYIVMDADPRMVEITKERLSGISGYQTSLPL